MWGRRKSVPSAELQYVFRLISAGLDGGIVPLPSHPLDHEKLITLLDLHGLTGYVARMPRAADALPEPVAQHVKERARQFSMRAMAHVARLHQLVVCLSSQGIRSLALKGPSLAMLLGGDVGWRMSSDIDLWVDPQRVQEARFALIELGYRDAEGYAEHQRKWLLARGDGATNHLVLVRGADDMVELHFQLAHAKQTAWQPPDFESAYENRQRVGMGQLSVYTLGDDDLARFIVWHGMKHRFRALKWVLDAGLCLNRVSSDTFRTVFEQRMLRVTTRVFSMVRGTEVGGQYERLRLRDWDNPTIDRPLALHLERHVLESRLAWLNRLRRAIFTPTVRDIATRPTEHRVWLLSLHRVVYLVGKYFFGRT